MIPSECGPVRDTGGSPATLPFLKWPGGKRWASAQIAATIRAHLNRTYYEPFLGGGAVFFHMRPRRAIISDINGELVRTYTAVRDSVDEIIAQLKCLPVNRRTYSHLQAAEPIDSIGRAVRFLYLNRTAFAGMYRLNLEGKFNVPYGGGERTPEILWTTPLLKTASRVLSRARIRQSDFEPMIESATQGDVVYCDPTYTVAHDHNGFIRYNEKNFSWADQIRLARAAKRASRRGAKVLITNANHRSIRQLYTGAVFQVLCRKSLVSADASKRREIEELVIFL
jgi:DNA adenine methylase